MNEKHFTLPPILEVETADEARSIAIDWSNAQTEEILSYGELAEAQSYFTLLAAKFDLTEEFEENGIL